MKIILFLLLFINTLFSNEIKSVEILKDNPTINFENIKNNKNFKRTMLPITRDSKNSYWIKISINWDKLSQNKDYLLILKSRFDINSFILDTQNTKNMLNKNVILLDTKTKKKIYIKIENFYNFIDVNLRITQSTPMQYIKENNIYNELYGFSYGIIFSAFLYYLAFYLFNRQKSFIYYSLTQLSMLFILILMNTQASNEVEMFFYDISILSFVIFSNLFTKEFLNTKTYTPIINKFLTLIIVLYMVETLTYFFIDLKLPTSIFLLFYIIASVIVYNKTKFKPILFYILGWSIMIISFIFMELESMFISSKLPYIDPINIIYIAVPLESLILAFALSYKLKLLENSNIEKEKILLHQNKLASIGEMINNIAHQWRQPLTHLSYIFMNINTAFKHDKLSAKYLETKNDEATLQLEYMSKTIDDFKDFYTSSKDKVAFNIFKATKKSILIASATLESQKIKLELSGDKEATLHGYESEYSQVMLNLISNAKDAFIKNNIQNPKIEIFIKKGVVKISDNAEGIDADAQDKIYHSNFTTKNDGMGIGLYMSKVIIETHFNAKLYHKNIANGTCFYIEI